MATKAVNLRYRSAERFHRDYRQLKSGKIFLPSKTPLPVATTLALNFSLPGIDPVFVIPGTVIKSLDPQSAQQIKKKPGMLVAVTGAADVALEALDAALGAHDRYRRLLASTGPAQNDTPHVPDPSSPSTASPEPDARPKGLKSLPDVPDPKTPAEDLPPSDPAPELQAPSPRGPHLPPAKGTALSLEWLREAIAQEGGARKQEAAPEITVAPSTEKKELTLGERKKAKPSGEFLMDLTKAMLRSGYYSSEHPGARNAKRGLYDAFQKCLGDSAEIMITHQETREKSDILITGILDEPVNVRTLVGAGMAELFVPKLREYFKRKALISFAIKKRITVEHFERFVDIMSDPRADQGEKHHVGELLSGALVKHGITEISTVFMDDMIALEQNLPWRVEMAIQRLAKDLKVLPMFKSESDDAIRGLKLQIIQDIIRPLRHPEFLKDLIINCYIIAKHVESVETEDIEKVIIEAFPLDTLLPTSRFIFEELERLRELSVDNPDNPTLTRRFAGVRRILKWVARRLVLADVRGAQNFLEQLYSHQVLTFEELPADVQYLVNTAKMAADVQNNTRRYLYRILKAESGADAVLLLKCFHRVMPLLIEQDQWQIVLFITRAVAKAARESPLFSGDAGLPAKPQKFIFKGLDADLVAAYEKADEACRRIIDEITSRLGSQGIEILARVLSDCDDRGARKAATEALTQRGELARRWVLKVLDDPKQPWYLLRNALMILRFVGKTEIGIDRARKLAAHPHPRVRDEALHTAIGLKARDAEQLIIGALNDEDDKVRWRATTALGNLSQLSQAACRNLLEMITAAAPEDSRDEIKHARTVTQLIRAMGGLTGLQDTGPVEDAILQVAQNVGAHKKGLLSRLKKSDDPSRAAILSAAVATLAKIGTSKSEQFLEKLAATKSPRAEAARKAVESIRRRLAEAMPPPAAA